MGVVMNGKRLCVQLALALPPLAALAGQGIVPPAAEQLWPQWGLRIAVQAAPLSPINLALAPDGATPARAGLGATVLGDYYFGSSSLGHLRASGGMMAGYSATLPLADAAAAPRLGLSLQGLAAANLPGTDGTGALPYLGFGYTGAISLWHQPLSVTADFGIVAERAGGLGRAIFGNQGMESALRDLRLSPVLQVGLRYSF
jgi:hypothetical protein